MPCIAFYCPKAGRNATVGAFTTSHHLDENDQNDLRTSITEGLAIIVIAVTRLRRRNTGDKELIVLSQELPNLPCFQAKFG